MSLRAVTGRLPTPKGDQPQFDGSAVWAAGGYCNYSDSAYCDGSHLEQWRGARRSRDVPLALGAGRHQSVLHAPGGQGAHGADGMHALTRLLRGRPRARPCRPGAAEPTPTPVRPRTTSQLYRGPRLPTGLADAVSALVSVAAVSLTGTRRGPTESPGPGHQGAVARRSARRPLGAPACGGWRPPGPGRRSPCRSPSAP
jgi:hypothetical protein